MVYGKKKFRQVFAVKTAFKSFRLLSLLGKLQKVLIYIYNFNPQSVLNISHTQFSRLIGKLSEVIGRSSPHQFSPDSHGPFGFSFIIFTPNKGEKLLVRKQKKKTFCLIHILTNPCFCDVKVCSCLFVMKNTLCFPLRSLATQAAANFIHNIRESKQRTAYQKISLSSFDFMAGCSFGTEKCQDTFHKLSNIHIYSQYFIQIIQYSKELNDHAVADIREKENIRKAFNEIFLSKTYFFTWHKLFFISRDGFALQFFVFIGFMIIYALRELMEKLTHREVRSNSRRQKKRNSLNLIVFLIDASK